MLCICINTWDYECKVCSISCKKLSRIIRTYVLSIFLLSYTARLDIARQLKTLGSSISQRLCRRLCRHATIDMISLSFCSMNLRHVHIYNYNDTTYAYIDFINALAEYKEMLYRFHHASICIPVMNPNL